MGRITKIFIVSIAVLLTFSMFFSGITDFQYKKQESDSLYGTSDSDKEIIIKYKNPDKADQVKDDLKHKLNLTCANTVKKLWVNNTELIRIDRSADIDLVLDELKRSPDIEYACSNYFTPELSEVTYIAKPLLNLQWGHNNYGQVITSKDTGVSGIDANILEAWNITKGSKDVIVGVLDTGIDINHKDLKDNIFINTKEIASNRIDDDKNGYIDDINGWDFVNDDNSVYDSANEDQHGTGVAGLIAAKSSEQFSGINGVAPNVKIMPLKFRKGLDDMYFGKGLEVPERLSDTVDAIGYAKSMGVSIINCSFTFSYSEILEDAIKQSDILFVCAAGNQKINLDENPEFYYYCLLPNFLSVASINSKGQLSSFSNYGKRVDLAAPGENILTTYPGKDHIFSSGTSYAAPYAAGTAALLKSYMPGITADEMAAAIKYSARPLDSLKDKTATGGMLDAYEALRYCINKLSKYKGINVAYSGNIGKNGWYISDVNVSLKFINPKEDGNKSIFYSNSYIYWNRYKNPITLKEGPSMIYYCATDEKGNKFGIKKLTVKIDKSLPKIDMSSPKEGMSYILGSVTAMNWHASDSISGISLENGSVPNGSMIPTSKPGMNNVTISAEDKAGNTKTLTVNYRVIYKYTGVSEPKAGKTYKCGSPLQVKFGLSDAKGTIVTAAKAKLYVSKITNGAAGKEATAKSALTSVKDNGFKYDKKLKQYVYSLSTKGFSAGTWRLRIELDDGTSKCVKFTLK